MVSPFGTRAGCSRLKIFRRSDSLGCATGGEDCCIFCNSCSYHVSSGAPMDVFVYLWRSLHRVHANRIRRDRCRGRVLQHCATHLSPLSERGSVNRSSRICLEPCFDPRRALGRRDLLGPAPNRPLARFTSSPSPGDDALSGCVRSGNAINYAHALCHIGNPKERL